MAENPADIAADIARDAAILDYRPSFDREAPLGIPDNVDHTVHYPGGESVHAGAAHTIALLATYSDIKAMTAWYETALPAYRTALAPRTVPVATEALSSTEQAALQKIYGDSLTFADVYNAYKNPVSPFSAQIMTAWNRYQFGINGSVDAQMYFILDRSATAYLPVVAKTAESLIAVTSYAMLGLDSSNSTEAHLAALAAQVASGEYTISSNTLAAYLKIQDTLAAQTSEMAYQAAAVFDIIAQQEQFPSDAGSLSNELGCSLDNVSKGGGASSSLNEIISILQGLETIYEIASAGDWLTWQGIETKMEQLGQNVIFELISEAAVVMGHVEAMLTAPLVGLVQSINAFLCSSTTEATDRALNALTMLMEQQVGKFEKYALDMYRHTWLANDLSTRQLTSTSSNNKSRNIVKTVDTIIAVLKTIQEIESVGLVGLATSVVGQEVGNIANTAVGNAITSINGGTDFKPITAATIGSQVQTILHNDAPSLVKLPAVPALTVSKPPPNTSIATAISTPPKPSLTVSGTPGDVASGLLNNISGQGTA